MKMRSKMPNNQGMIEALPVNRGRVAHLIIESQDRWEGLHLADLWRYRELLYFLTWRDIKVRYKQTLLGAAWAILQPVLTMIVFSIIFGQLAQLPSEGIPYPIFTYTALLPWQLFAFALANSSNSLVGNQNLVSKVYFPRLVIPIAAVLPGLVDFCIAFVVLAGMMLFYQVPVTPRIVWLPLLLLLAVATALAVGIWLSALNVEYRDVRYVVPFLTLFWQYATPIAYSSTLIPDRWRLLYGLNPVTGVVEGFRWALLGKGTTGDLIWISAAIVCLLLFTGMAYFKRMEASFADVI
jgi:lipopolysaccharide transport system permease protein